MVEDKEMKVYSKYILPDYFVLMTVPVMTFHDFQKMEVPKTIYMKLGSPETQLLFVGRPFSRKLLASRKKCAEPYRRNILGPSCQK